MSVDVVSRIYSAKTREELYKQFRTVVMVATCLVISAGSEVKTKYKGIFVFMNIRRVGFLFHVCLGFGLLK